MNNSIVSMLTEKENPTVLVPSSIENGISAVFRNLADTTLKTASDERRDNYFTTFYLRINKNSG
ncbi:MAG: hypothetical protein NTZ20_05455 [Candidatus Levybacteria bacterium]|nr:hypothetical protein [Candidatus Levybacteria bacterium]